MTERDGPLPRFGRRCPHHHRPHFGFGHGGGSVPRNADLRTGPQVREKAP
ncbi:hypothetical protein [Amycolatopsis sp. PS_44_ISF1]|nr:hypothetical protein [Amycolatopsis sp. PS_44_ISF1]MDT8909779.1 hypothetical protein [Amycolatopsis sp. PS_44_ISF1]